MKKIFFRCLFLTLLFGLVCTCFAYEEGPSSYGNWVYGKITYRDGSKCGNCCDIVLETNNGMSENGCTNSRGEYKIYIASKYVRSIYFKGTKVWSGSKSCWNGVRIDLVVK